MSRVFVYGLTLGAIASSVWSCSDSGGVAQAPVVAAPLRNEAVALPDGQVWPKAAIYDLATSELRLEGFFRPQETGADLTSPRILVPDPEKPWLPHVAEPGALASGQFLPSILRVDPQVVAHAIGTIAPSDEEAGSILTIELTIARDGQVDLAYIGASPGKVPMRGGIRRRAEYARYHAVESETTQPTEFILSGLPDPRPGSLTVEFADYMDDWVATTMIVRVAGPGSILMIVEDGGPARLRPSGSVQAAGQPLDKH